MVHAAKFRSDIQSGWRKAFRAANTTQQTEGLRLRRGAKPQAVQKYDKARRPRRSNDVSRVVLVGLIEFRCKPWRIL